MAPTLAHIMHDTGLMASRSRIFLLLAFLVALLVPRTSLAGDDTVVYAQGRARVREVLKTNDGWKAPPNTVVYVLGGNFDYGPLQRAYMSPARTAARELGLPVIDSTANPNGSVADNATKIRADLTRVLAQRPGVTVLVSANSKGYPDLYEALSGPGAPAELRAASNRIGVFALTPNWGGAPKAQTVVDHPAAEKVVAKLLSHPRSPWDHASLADITPAARQRAIAGYAARPAGPTFRTIVATAYLGRRAGGSDLIVPHANQIPNAPHERWEFSHATHGSFTMNGLPGSRSTNLQKAGLMQLSRQMRR